MSSRYRAGDLVVESDLPISLPPAAEDATADFVVEVGAAPRAACDDTTVDSPGVATACFERGSQASRVWVEPAPGVSDAELQWFVRGIVVPTALQRRGAFFVHAGSAVVDGALLALVGESGVGKSTLAAQVARAGHRFFGDDSLVLDVEQPVRALLGSSPLRLTTEAAQAFGIDPEHYAACTQSGKRLVPPGDVGAELDDGTPPLGALYFARRGAELRIAPCAGAEAVAGLLAAEFHPSPDARQAADERARFEAVASIAASVPLRRLEYPTNLDTVPRVVAALVRDYRELRER